jgi:hypothetical protein
VAFSANVATFSPRHSRPRRVRILKQHNSTVYLGAGMSPSNVSSSPMAKVRRTTVTLTTPFASVDHFFFFCLLPFAPLGDPWREATTSSDLHPRQSTDTQPIAISDGFHCSDLVTQNGDVDPTVKAVQVLANQYMTKWLGEWYTQYNVPAPGLNSSSVTSGLSSRIRRKMSEA